MERGTPQVAIDAGSKKMSASSIHCAATPSELDPPPSELDSQRERGPCHRRLRPPFQLHFLRRQRGGGVAVVERRDDGRGKKRLALAEQERDAAIPAEKGIR